MLHAVRVRRIGQCEKDDRKFTTLKNCLSISFISTSMSVTLENARKLVGLGMPSHTDTLYEGTYTHNLHLKSDEGYQRGERRGERERKIEKI